MNEVNIDPKEIMESLKNRKYHHYCDEKYSTPERLHNKTLNCKDMPSEEYNAIFKNLEESKFHHRDEVIQEFERIYRKYFTFLSPEEFKEFMNTKYHIFLLHGAIRIRKRE